MARAVQWIIRRAWPLSSVGYTSTDLICSCHVNIYIISNWMSFTMGNQWSLLRTGVMYEYSHIFVITLAVDFWAFLKFMSIFLRLNLSLNYYYIKNCFNFLWRNKSKAVERSRIVRWVDLLLLLMGAHAGVKHRGSHGSAPAQGVPARGVPCLRPSW